MLNGKKVNQWSFWLSPAVDKINWIKAGFDKGEFFFVENKEKELVGMFRLMQQDELYWGEQEAKARYIHSLVVEKKFSGKQIGNKIIKLVEQEIINQGIFKLRLDCNAGNPILCSYYENQGFVKVGEKQMVDSLNNLFEKELLPDFPLRNLIGQWKGSGRGKFPSIASFNYEEELRFEFIPEKERLFYYQKAVFIDTQELVHLETGFITKIKENEFELNNAQSGGRNEILRLQILQKKDDFLKLLLTQLDIENDKKGLIKTEREIIVQGDKLNYIHKMHTNNEPMQTHLETSLFRQ